VLSEESVSAFTLTEAPTRTHNYWILLGPNQERTVLDSRDVAQEVWGPERG
jgi:hypothetical protein